jgi:hypothetical protein
MADAPNEACQTERRQDGCGTRCLNAGSSANRGSSSGSGGSYGDGRGSSSWNSGSSQGSGENWGDNRGLGRSENFSQGYGEVMENLIEPGLV